MSLFDPSRPTITIAQLQARIGTETGVSRWFEISQARIDAFAEVTEDRQFIHVDPVAAKATPFGGTVAHGFLTMSMLSAIAYDALPRVEGPRACQLSATSNSSCCAARAPRQPR
jgi:acyl dehydratase